MFKKKIFPLILLSFFIGGIAMCQNNREEMVATQLKGRHIHDPKVLKAMSKVPRELFVDEEQRELAYVDYPLPIGYGQTISQPYIVAFMTEAAQLKPSDKILEIGTGCGYQAAILAEICKEVYSLEIIEGLANEAKIRLKNLGYDNIHVRHGDGYKGWELQAPFDAVIVTAAPETVPQSLIRQLKIGGKLIIPVGILFQQLMRIIRNKEGVTEEILMPVRFVQMTHNN
jgi:protein-L-isoaspartate(D-aspartate) O-methyltransferase